MENADLPKPQSKVPPDEERLVVLLGNLRPYPTNRLFHRMATAPWKSGVPATRQHRWSPLGVLAASSLLLIFAVISIFAFPSLTATARRLISFFAPSPSQSMVLQVTAPSPGDPNIFGSPGYFNLTLPEAERQAGFKVRTISVSEVTYLIPGLEFTGAHYDTNLQAVIIRYSAENHSLFLTQRKHSTIEEYNTIGPETMVEQVNVRGVMGEYVTGGWKSAETPMITPRPGDQVNLDVTWDPSLPQHILRWEESGFLFEILTSAGLGRQIDIEKEELIKIAESMR